MKSIKPGRGPSFMGGIGSIIMGLFGVLWTLAAASMGAPVAFCLFGVLFIVVAVVNAIYNFANATAKNRFSVYDIVEGGEEEDPLNRRYGEKSPEENVTAENETNFCPYCGQKVEGKDRFCRRCGEELPQ